MEVEQKFDAELRENSMPKEKSEFPSSSTEDAPLLEEETADSIFRSQARKLGIPEDGCTFDPDELSVVWKGSGTTCAKILSSIEEKLRSNGFELRPPAKESSTDHPFDDADLATYQKENEGWRATVMMKSDVRSSIEDDSATVLFFVEERTTDEVS